MTKKEICYYLKSKGLEEGCFLKTSITAFPYNGMNIVVDSIFTVWSNNFRRLFRQEAESITTHDLDFILSSTVEELESWSIATEKLKNGQG